MPSKKAAFAFACETLDVDVRNNIGLVALNRPDVHNAFNEKLIGELTTVLQALDAQAGGNNVVNEALPSGLCS